MKNLKRIIFFSLVLGIFLFSVKAEAKWWIFGKSEDEVGINYLYLNQISYDEFETKVTLYKDLLQDGMIYIKGKASVKKGKIGAVQVSIDGKEKWEKAKLSKDGTFLFSFKPEISKVYNIYVKVIDTTGKTNSVDLTHKEVTVVESNIQSIIKDVLAQMIDAYKKEDAGLFMSFVSDDFVSDKIVLERAIRNDFSAFENIDLRYTINNLVSDSKGKIFVSLNFNRMVISSKTGKSFTDKGTTEFVFKLEGDKPKVYSMKHPLIFGLSDAGNIATGVVKLSTNEQIIVVDENGNVAEKPFDEATGGESSTIESGNFTLKTACDQGSGVCVHQGFNFEEGEVILGIIPGDDSSPTNYDIYMELNLMFLNNGVSQIDLGIKSISEIKEVPDSGYKEEPFVVSENTGHCFAIKLANGKYAVVEIVNFAFLNNGSSANFRYKYQPNGSRNF